jgi:transcriptional regulator with XRE-family HTH domain
MKQSSQLKSARLANHFSVREIAEFFGICTSTVYYWESGQHTPPNRYIKALSQLYGIRLHRHRRHKKVLIRDTNKSVMTRNKSVVKVYRLLAPQDLIYDLN